MPPLYIFFRWPYPSGLQWFSHQGPLPLPHLVRCTVIPVILLSTPRWNTSITLRISPITTQLSLPYNNTNCTTALHRIPRSHTIAPVFNTTLPTISAPSKGFFYWTSQSMLPHATVRTRYINNATSSRGSDFTLIETRLDSKHCCGVVLLIRCSSLTRNVSDS